MPIIARHLTITGRVQGVFYRSWTVQTAQALGLVGWVRNRMNGDVEALVQGEEEQIMRFIELARRGPPAARVDEVLDVPVDVGAHVEFEQRSTS